MHLSLDLIGIIPDDDRVITSSNKGEPIVLEPSTQVGKAYRNIVRRVMGESVPLMTLEKEKQGIFTKFKALFSK